MEVPLNKTEVVLYAHQFFSTFKRLLVDLQCSYYERIQSRKFFLHRSAEEAFRVIEVELEFMYDMLFTKASVVYNKTGFVFRLFCSALVVTSFVLFYRESNRFKPSDVAITYALLVGAIALDVIAFYQLIMSNWFIVVTRLWHHANWPLRTHKTTPEAEAIRPKMRSVPTLNLIDYCLRLPQLETRKIMDRLGFRLYFDWFSYVEPKACTKELWEHIFKEVKERSELAESVGNFKDAITARGDWVLRVDSLPESTVRDYVDGMDYDRSLLSWHIATELCWLRRKMTKSSR